MPLVGQIALKPYWQDTKNRLRLYHGDCLAVLARLPPHSVDLVFADPPFNTGYGYDQYDDSSKTDQEYLSWSLQWLEALHRVLRPTGSIYVASGVPLQAELRRIMDQVGFRWRDTICWHYTFGPRQLKRFTPSWVAIHYATMSGRWTWNPEAIMIPSSRQLIYNDRRAVKAGKVPDNVWALTPSQQTQCWQPWHNCWQLSRVCGTFKERTNHPCQMPLSLLERIIRVSSQPEDVVLDPFLGSGTTAAAALAAGRHAWGIELSEAYLRDCCLPRLQPLLEEISGSPHPQHPYTPPTPPSR